jgi:hypothetical protein
VIQIRQKIALAKNPVADDLAAMFGGIATQERLTKNTVASYATTLCVPLLFVSSDTTKLVKSLEQLPHAIV